MYIKNWIISLLILCSPGLTLGQSDSISHDFGGFGGMIYLDSLIVSATRNGFDVQDFIERVRADESFYQAFDNLRTLSYHSDNSIHFFDKKGRPKATYHAIIQQHSDGRCRQMSFFEELSSGNFYKRKHKRKHRYYTAKMHSELFLTYGTVCEPLSSSKNKPKGIQKHITELKKLIFNPGEKADVPLIGKKTALFSDRMKGYYNYSISSEKYKGLTDCYVFTAEVKPEYLERKKDKTVIKYLKTYFSKDNLQIVARDYYLYYYGALFDFDVRMNVELTKFGALYVPEKIEYDGFWDIPARKPEIAKFTLTFYSFSQPSALD